MFEKIKYYLLAFIAGITTIAVWVSSRKSKHPLETEALDKRIEDKKEHIKELENTEVKVDNLKPDEVVDYWKNK